MPRSSPATTDEALAATGPAAHRQKTDAAPAQKPARSPALYTVLYDDQCEICQAFVTWLRVLDRRHRVSCVPITPGVLDHLGPRLSLDACLREIHVLSADGRVWVGWDGVAVLARQFPATWLIGALGGVPPLRWVGRMAYRWVAANRYALSKCRGGACGVVRLDAVRRLAPLGPFWGCYTLGMLVRLPLILGAAVLRLGANIAAYWRTFRRRIDLLGGRLSLLFLGGIPCDAVPILFGEQFMTVLYDGVAVDPGSPRMRRSLARNLGRMPPGAIRAIVATHHHEEHVGNLNWLARRTGAAIHVSETTVRLLRPPRRLPWVRAFVIGQPPPLDLPFEILGPRLATATGSLRVIPSPGHCDDHVVLYDPREKLLLAGDAFMGVYFATPNPDVDSLRWMETLERLLELDIEILVEGHGHIHTLRPDIPDIPGVVVRQAPREALEGKLHFLRWLRRQVEAGLREGLPIGAVRATCCPWGHGWPWKNLISDEAIRLLSLGHFSRTELVQSFLRDRAGREVFPTVYQAEFYQRPAHHLGPCDPGRDLNAR